jgi:hypothetical protein
MEQLGDVGHVETHLSLFGDRVSFDARQTYHRLRNRSGCTQWYSKVMRLKWKLNSVRLKIVLILTRVRCMACTKRTVGSEMVLDAPDGSPR